MRYKTKTLAGKISKKTAPYQGAQIANVSSLMRSLAVEIYNTPLLTKLEALQGIAELDKLAVEAITMITANRNHWVALLHEGSD